MKKFILAGTAITIAIGGFWATQAEADTFYGVLVPMTTPVTLSASESSLTIGTTLALTYGGGDGTGGYRFNNNSNGFCSISTTGVVTANFPGTCSFTVTRLATGKYLDTTSSALTLTALPEPDKSVISTPSPDPTPTQTPRATPSPTSTATSTPQVSPSPAATRIRTTTETVVKQPVQPPLKKISGLKASLASAGDTTTYKFTWGSDRAAISYSINMVTPEGKKNLSSATASVNLENLTPGTYSIEIQGIDATGKLSTPVLSKFTVPVPKVVKLTVSASLAKPSISSALSSSLDRFALQTTPGTAIAVAIEYSKSKANDANVKKLADLVKQYLAAKREGSKVSVTLTPVKESGSIAIIRGLGQRQSPTLLLRR